MPPSDFAGYRKYCVITENVVNNLRMSLPPLQPYNSNTASDVYRRTLVVAHATVAAASIKMHTIFSTAGNTNSFRRRKDHALWILDNLCDTSMPGSHHVPPIAGLLLNVACQVVIDEIRSLVIMREVNSFPGYHQAGANSNRPTDEELALRACLSSSMSTMSMLAADSALMSEFFALL